MLKATDQFLPPDFLFSITIHKDISFSVCKDPGMYYRHLFISFYMCFSSR